MRSETLGPVSRGVVVNLLFIVRYRTMALCVKFNYRVQASVISDGYYLLRQVNWVKVIFCNVSVMLFFVMCAG